MYVVVVVGVGGETLEIKLPTTMGDDAVKKKNPGTFDRVSVRAKGGRRCRGFSDEGDLSLTGALLETLHGYITWR